VSLIFYNLAWVSSYRLSNVPSVLPMGLCRLDLHWHPCQKHPRYSKTSLVSAQYPSSFTLGTPGKWDLPSITSMNNIVSRPTNVRQPLKGLNRLAISHSVHSSRYNTYSVCFQKYCPEHVTANWRYSDVLPKWVHFDEIEKQFPKRTACLPQYIDIVHTVGQQPLLSAENFLLFFS